MWARVWAKVWVFYYYPTFFGNEHVTIISFYFVSTKICSIAQSKAKQSALTDVIAFFPNFVKKGSKIAKYYVRCFGGHEKVAYNAINGQLK